MGSLGGLGVGRYLCWAGPALGRDHVHGLPLQEESEAGGGSNQALGTWRQSGQIELPRHLLLLTSFTICKDTL